MLGSLGRPKYGRRGRRRIRTALAGIDDSDLLPRGIRSSNFDRILPRGPLAWASAVLVVLVFLMFFLGWIERQPELLYDPNYENDDVRTALFPFHRYGPEHTLGDDPIANEMSKFLMPGISVAYRVLVPLVGIFV